MSAAESPPDLSDRVVFLKNEMVNQGQPDDNLTVMASFNNFFKLGVINVYLPAKYRSDNKYSQFNARELVEGTDPARVANKAAAIFSSLLRQLKNQQTGKKL